jgi:hypothetical protein
MVNACDTREQGQACRFRDACHAAFGTVAIEDLGEVGLYPYNHIALRRAVEHLGDSPTPRDVLDQCVSTNLQEADGHVRDGDYPHERTRQQFDFKVRMAKDAVQASNPSLDPERNYRALVIWGDEAALPAGILDAFSLDGVPQTGLTRPAPATPPQPEQRPDDLPNPLLSLFQWQVGGDLLDDDANYYRDALRRLTADRLQLDQSLVHVHDGRGKEVLDRLFNVTSFAIQGSRGRQAGAQSVRFDLTPSDQDVHVMAAARWFRDHGHFDPTRAKWQWPEGYDPAQLMVELEARLDSWAAEVRRRFIELTGGARLARQAVGVRCVALAAAGRRLSELRSTAAVLNPPIDTSLPASEAWASVDAVAANIASSLKVDEYIGEFAAVRQGETGEPQLIDPRDLDAAIKEFLEDPQQSLGEVASSQADPVLARAAEQLLGAVAAAAPHEAESVRLAHEAVTSLLEGRSISSVAVAAGEVGTVARDAGLFRPTNAWRVFDQTVDALDASSSVDLSVPDTSDSNALVRGQRAMRELSRVAQQLAFVKAAMDQTKQECERGGGMAGNVATLQTTVKSHIDDLAELVNSLAGEGHRGD